jgi:DedD protein
VQLGVFSDTANAVALHERLTKAGVKSRIESRLFLGPFATRTEADAALAQMKKLGVQAVVEERR